LILHLPFLSFVGPKIFLNTFFQISVTRFFLIVPSKTHVSQSYVIIGRITLQYSFNFDFLETNLLLTKYLRHWKHKGRHTNTSGHSTMFCYFVISPSCRFWMNERTQQIHIQKHI
jgi:hypothetical protein